MGSRRGGLGWAAGLGAALLAVVAVLLLIPPVDPSLGGDTPLTPLARRLPRIDGGRLRGGVPATPVGGAQDTHQGQDRTGATGATGPATVDRLVHDPDVFVGKTVAVTGEIGEVLSRNADTAFTIEDEDFVRDERVLVIDRRPIRQSGGLPLIEEDQVRVTGIVRRFDRAALERELGLTLSPDIYAPWRGRPVIVLSAIDFTPGPAGSG